MNLMLRKRSNTRWYLCRSWHNLTPVDTWHLTQTRAASEWAVSYLITKTLGRYNQTNWLLLPFSPRSWKAMWDSPTRMSCDCMGRPPFSTILKGPSVFILYKPWCTKIDPQLSRIQWPPRAMASLIIRNWNRCGAPRWYKTPDSGRIIATRYKRRIYKSSRKWQPAASNSHIYTWERISEHW